jgi:hypothetical protein
LIHLKRLLLPYITLMWSSTWTSTSASIAHAIPTAKNYTVTM